MYTYIGRIFYVYYYVSQLHEWVFTYDFYMSNITPFLFYLFLFFIPYPFQHLALQVTLLWQHTCFICFLGLTFIGICLMPLLHSIHIPVIIIHLWYILVFSFFYFFSPLGATSLHIPVTFHISGVYVLLFARPPWEDCILPFTYVQDTSRCSAGWSCYHLFSWGSAPSSSSWRRFSFSPRMRITRMLWIYHYTRMRVHTAALCTVLSRITRNSCT